MDLLSQAPPEMRRYALDVQNKINAIQSDISRLEASISFYGDKITRATASTITDRIQLSTPTPTTPTGTNNYFFTPLRGPSIGVHNSTGRVRITISATLIIKPNSSGMAGDFLCAIGFSDSTSPTEANYYDEPDSGIWKDWVQKEIGIGTGSGEAVGGREYLIPLSGSFVRDLPLGQRYIRMEYMVNSTASSTVFFSNRSIIAEPI